jgi:competence protein ComGF
VVILKNDKGFTFTEALVSLAVLMIISTSIIPLSSFVIQEKKALSQKRIITYKLHDELQSFLYNDLSPFSLEETIESAEVIFTFKETEDQFIQACAAYKNIMNRKEEVCLYGLSEK